MKYGTFNPTSQSGVRSGIGVGGIQTLTDAATITFNLAARLNGAVTLGGNRSLSITNPSIGDSGYLEVTQDGTGGRSLTLPASSIVQGVATTAIALNTTAGGMTLLRYFYDGTNYYWEIATQSSTFKPVAYNYTVAGSYNLTIPTNATFYEFVCQGGGGGGGSGRKGALATARYGGGHGGAGAQTIVSGSVSDLLAAGSSLTIAVGAGGAGGASQTVNSTNGNSGSPGAITTIVAGSTNFAAAASGNLGGGGTNAAGTSGGAPGIGMYLPGSSNNALLTGTPTTSSLAMVCAANGGAGGSIDASNVVRAGANGGVGAGVIRGTSSGNPVGGAAGGVAGGAGTTNPGVSGGNGGAGGGASTAGDAGAGGNGIMGSGGGGGGASLDSMGNSGAGGAGGDGFATVRFW